MCGLELRLQVFVILVSLLHFLVGEELIRNGNWHEELRSVGPALKLWKLGDQPMQNVLHCLLLAVHNIALEGGVEVARVAQHLQESADALLGLVLRLALDVDGEVLLVEVAEFGERNAVVNELWGNYPDGFYAHPGNNNKVPTKGYKGLIKYLTKL